MMKNITNLFSMYCNVHHYPAKIKIIIQLMYGKKVKLYYRIKQTGLHNLRGKLS